MKFPLPIKKEPLALIKNLILAEIAIGLFLFGLASFTNYQTIYSQSFFGRLIRYDISLVILASFLQLLATLMVFLKWHSQHYESRLSILDLIVGGENNNLELKQSFRWDSKQNALNKDLEKTVMKSVAGFLNSEGGKIIVGVTDDKSIPGLEKDYATLQRKDRDGFENHFNQVFNNIVGAKFRHLIKTAFSQIDNKDVCLIEIQPAPEPVYITLYNNAEEFYIRSGNITSPLPISKASDYIKSRWK